MLGNIARPHNVKRNSSLSSPKDSGAFKPRRTLEEGRETKERQKGGKREARERQKRGKRETKERQERDKREARGRQERKRKQSQEARDEKKEREARGIQEGYKSTRGKLRQKALAGSTLRLPLQPPSIFKTICVPRGALPRSSLAAPHKKNKSPIIRDSQERSLHLPHEKNKSPIIIDSQERSLRLPHKNQVSYQNR